MWTARRSSCLPRACARSARCSGAACSLCRPHFPTLQVQRVHGHVRARATPPNRRRSHRHPHHGRHRQQASGCMLLSIAGDDAPDSNAAGTRRRTCRWHRGRDSSSGSKIQEMFLPLKFSVEALFLNAVADAQQGADSRSSTLRDILPDRARLQSSDYQNKGSTHAVMPPPLPHSWCLACCVFEF